MEDKDKEDRLIWLDCETTGLDSNKDLLLQVAVIVTDSNLVPVAEGLEVTISHSETATRSLMDDYVTKMHTASGLLAAVINEDNNVWQDDAEQAILTYLQEHTIAGKSPMCGNSIAFDRGIIKLDMPLLNEHFHYRNIDVSTVKELARRWHPEAYRMAPAKQLNHTALSDIKESIAELEHYRGCGLL